MLKQKHTAILYILLAALFFSGMTAFVHLSGDLPTGQKALFRNLPALFIAAFISLAQGNLSAERGAREPAAHVLAVPVWYHGPFM